MNGCIAIGDIHGCLYELQELIELLEREAFLSDDTRLVFLGDYLDRGPNGAGVIDYLLKLRHRRNCVFLEGNHDRTFRRHLSNAQRFRPANGEYETVLAYSKGTLDRTDITHFLEFVVEGLPLAEAVRQTGRARGKRAVLDVPEAHMEFLCSLAPFWQEDRIVFCHGGVKAEWGSFEKALLPTNSWDLMTARGEAEHFLKVPGRVQVVGHRRRDDVTVRGWICMIDTDCIGGGMLSALAMPEGWSSVFDFDIRQVRAKRNWREVFWSATMPLVPEYHVPSTRRRRDEKSRTRRIG